MKTQIIISGGIAGNHEILSKLHSYSKRDNHFSDYFLYYETDELAAEDLFNAYNTLCEQEPDMVDNLAGGIYMHDNMLTYDASTAKIVEQ